MSATGKTGSSLTRQNAVRTLRGGGLDTVGFTQLPERAEAQTLAADMATAACRPSLYSNVTGHSTTGQDVRKCENGLAIGFPD